MKSINVSGIKKWVGLGVVALVSVLITFNSILVYNEAGYQTHIRTIFGEEKVATDVGYAAKWFGRATPWKQAQTVQFVLTDDKGEIPNNVDDSIGAVIDYKIVFLGNVDGSSKAIPLYAKPVPADKPAVAVVPECFKRLYNHARGMRFGTDWNNGAAARHNRQPLIDATWECDKYLSEIKNEG